MRWLIDGMNLIGSRPTGWWRDREGAMRELVAALDGFAEESGAEVAVVFDGRERELSPERVEVAFASRAGRDAADDDIAARVEADPDPGSLRVVTSDAALADRVRSGGATVVPVMAFWRELEG
jgi:predicted RNA-binding protein with PIN domain